MSQKHTTTWNSRLGFILASAGSAVGLGAIWKFPYMAGANGGAPFLLVSLLFGFSLGLILLISEFSVGRAGRSDPVDSVRRVCGRFWPFFAATGILTGFLILCFYSCVAGWCLKYFVDAVLLTSPSADADSLKAYFDAFTKNGPQSLFYQYLFLLLNALVLCGGVNKGIERISKILMPTLFAMILILIVRGLTLPGAVEGLKYMFLPHFNDFNLSAILNAMGYTFFSLSLGSGAMISYGSYLSKDANLMTSTSWVVFLAIFSSVLGGLTVLPTVFAFGLNPAEGPGLTFVTMPAIFANLPFGQLFAVIFYLCLVVAALTSSISMAESSILYLNRRWGVRRLNAVAFVTLAAAFVGTFCTLSFGAISEVKFFNRTFFDLLDYSTSNLGMSLSAFGIALGAAWAGWRKVKPQLIESGLTGKFALGSLRIAMGVICPILILIIVAGSI